MDANGKLIMSDDDYVDTWKEMEKCVDQGLVKSIGISNFNTVQTTRILENARILPVTNQVELHPYFNQKKLLNWSKEKGIVLTAYSPLGTPARNDVPRKRENLLQHPDVLRIAQELGKSPGQIALRYLVNKLKYQFFCFNFFIV